MNNKQLEKEIREFNVLFTEIIKGFLDNLKDLEKRVKKLEEKEK